MPGAATVVRCERCGAKNRVPAAAPGVPRCAKCKAPLPWVVEANDENFTTVVEESTIPVLKHFTGNCHIYIDAATGSMEKEVRDICLNAKTSYPGGAVCNAGRKRCKLHSQRHTARYRWSQCGRPLGLPHPGNGRTRRRRFPDDSSDSH